MGRRTCPVCGAEVNEVHTLGDDLEFSVAVQKCSRCDWGWAFQGKPVAE